MDLILPDGLRLSYDLHPSASTVPVVFIHGFPFSRRMWQPQVDRFKGEYTLLTYDIRGHGESDTGDGHYSIELFIDDLFALLDHLGFGQVVLVGLSMGGYIALRAAERDPRRFKGLALCDTRSEADTNEARIRRAEQAKSIRTMNLAEFAGNFVKNAFAPESFVDNPDAVTLIRSTIEQTSRLSIAGTLLALAGRTDTTAFLPRLTCPVLVLVGEKDSITPPAAAQNMSDRIRLCELHQISHAGHVSTLEQPGEANVFLDLFFRKVMV